MKNTSYRYKLGIQEINTDIVTYFKKLLNATAS